jgi:hypothetical protein
MLISAKYIKDKISVLHGEDVAPQIAYCNNLSKDRSNGFTKERSMRRIGSFPDLVLKEYDRLHPGWFVRASCGFDLDVKQKAWREFLDSDTAKPFMTVEKMLH